MSIHPILEKIKGLIDREAFTHFLMIFTILLVGFAGFGIGKMTNKTNPTIKIITPPPSETISSKNEVYNLNQTNNGIKTGGEAITASKNGTKYYFSWCKGINNIKEENKIFFGSENEAKNAGYSKASSCK